MSFKIINGEPVQSPPVKLETMEDWIFLCKNGTAEFCNAISSFLPNADEMHNDDEYAIKKSIEDFEFYMNEPEIINNYEKIFYNIFSPAECACKSGCLPLFQYFIEKFEKKGFELDFFKENIFEDSYLSAVCQSGKLPIVAYVLEKINNDEVFFKELLTGKYKNLHRKKDINNIVSYLVFERKMPYTDIVKELIKEQNEIIKIFETRELQERLTENLSIKIKKELKGKV